MKKVMWRAKQLQLPS